MIQIEDINILELLPQQPPFVMVGKLIHFSDKTTETETVVYKDNIFVEGDYLEATGVLENIAQTCAARIGYVNKYILREKIQIGFIGAIRDFKIFSMPKVGETLKTRISLIEEIFGMSLVSAECYCGERLIATTNMKIAIDQSDKQIQ